MELTTLCPNLITRLIKLWDFFLSNSDNAV